MCGLEPGRKRLSEEVGGKVTPAKKKKIKAFTHEQDAAAPPRVHPHRNQALDESGGGGGGGLDE